MINSPYITIQKLQNIVIQTEIDQDISTAWFSTIFHSGKLVYSCEDDSTNVTPATTYSGVKIGSSSKDERGQYRGG